MNEYFRSMNAVAVIAYAALLVIALIPVWAVRYHITQDGPAHIYSAKVMLGLLRGDPVYASIYRFNPAPVPNATGHWLTALMLLVVDQFTAAKLISSLSFASVAGAVAWMWRRFSNGDGLITGILYGFVVAFNWLWLEGFYNFTLGVAGYAVALGLFAKRDRLNLQRTSLLALLSVLIYFSHQLCFVALAISLLMMAVCSAGKDRGRNLALTAAALLPTFALLAAYSYDTSGQGSGPLAWSNLASGSVTGWLTQLRTANPFMILLTRNLPFSDPSNYAPIFAPVLWIGVAIACLFLDKRGVANDESTGGRRTWKWAFAVLFLIFIAGALFAPDALAGGSIIRPRMTLFASIALVPLIGGASRKASHHLVATVILAAVFVFQCVALWDYSLVTNADAADLLAATDTIRDEQGLAGVTVATNAPRYPTEPLIHADGFIGGEHSVVWDIYETSLPSFPLIARSEEDRGLISRLNNDSVQDRTDPDTLSQLARDLDEAHERIGIIALWNGDDATRNVLGKWYEPVPGSSRGRAEIFRRRP